MIFEDAFEGLITQLQAKGDDNQPLDIRVALADFNGFNGYNSSASYGSPYDREENDTTNDTSWYSAANQAKVYSGTWKLDAGAFVAATEMSTDSSTYNFQYVSGTNYDYAFDAIYQLGHSVKKANAEMGEERDLYVVFMSDGAPMQYNYYHSQGNSTRWQYWLTGTVEDNGGFSSVVRCQDHTHYYDEATGNQHRMANAVKGDVSSKYEVIRKATTGLEDVLTATNEENMYMIPGLGATMFSIAFDPAADGNTPASAMTHVLEDIATEQTDATKYYYLADSATDLENAFKSIGSAIAYAATNARFVDQMGDDFNLQMKPIKDLHGNLLSDVENKIEIISYDIYTKADASAGEIPSGKNIGDRKGTYKVLETVTFSADGTKAYSDHVNGGTTNILGDGTQPGFAAGVIYAKTFIYNTNTQAVVVNGVNIPEIKADGTTTATGSSSLPAETFYWKLGTVQTSELAMRYYVYLDGSMEGTREAGSYSTNEFATLYYDNYRGKPCYKETVSPVVAWKSANVSYAFYLVDKYGNIIVNQTTGQTGTFANKVAVTNPVVYKEILLNNTDQIEALQVKALSDDVLPKYYDLYDDAAVYKVSINSDSTGGWSIEKGNEKIASTYVTQFDPQNASAYSNALSNNKESCDYTHTVVWFAVVWKVQAHPDTVVIDYGLPVDISVLTNDMFGANGKLAGVGAYTNGIENTTAGAALASGFGANYTGTYGTAKADAATGEVRYTPNTMAMNGYEKFAYAVHYTGNKNAGYYYDTVTVIPATTIYYEDNFVDLASYTWDYGVNAWAEVEKTDEKWTWSQMGTMDQDATQDEDRPGKYALTDANNIYGYDSVNLNLATYSLGSAAKATVDYDNYAQAQFSFYGTGFDIISMTSNMTGTILVDVEKETVVAGEDGTSTRTWTEFDNYAVDTYYGYTQESEDANGADGEMVWVVDSNAKDSLYQVPVIKMVDKEYGKWRVTIKATYDPIFDHVRSSEETDNYDFYLDAIRIYNPAGNGVIGKEDKTILNAYKADGEAWPSYLELRNNIIKANSFDNVANDALTTDMEGLVFVDGDASVGDAQISDYISYGPNNEVYLAPGQRVAFILNTPANIENVHIGIKSADGKPVTCSVANIARSTEDKIEAGQMYGEKKIAIDTATDMYYDLTGWIKKNSSENDVIVISNTNTGNYGILSLTNIKSTYKSDPNGVMTTALNDGVGDEEFFETYAYMTVDAAALILDSLNVDIEEETKQAPVIETDRPSSNRPARPGHTEPSKPEKVEKPVKPDAPNKPGVNKNDKKPGSVRENGWFF